MGAATAEARIAATAARAAVAAVDLPTPYERVEQQIAWYDRRSGTAKRSYLTLKVIQIVVAAAIPVIAAAGASAAAAGGLGALIVVLEGLQQLFQFHSNWAHYRGTCEALRHEKYLWAARAGLYARAGDPTALLAERVERLVSREHSAWASTQHDRIAHEAATA
jgi:uncharacterized protein DUF4231